MNRYLEKLAKVGHNEILNRLRSEYDSISDNRSISTKELGSLLDKKYWDVLLNHGGYHLRWEVKKDDAGKLYPSYEIQSSKPHIVTRAISPLYGVFQSKEDIEATEALSRLHEAIEADEFHNNILPIIKQNLGEGGPPTIDRGYNIGGHIGPAVVMRESNAVRDAVDNAFMKRVLKYRQKYDNPYLVAVSGKKYGEDFTPEDFDKARTFFDRPIIR